MQGHSQVCVSKGAAQLHDKHEGGVGPHNDLKLLDRVHGNGLGEGQAQHGWMEDGRMEV